MKILSVFLTFAAVLPLIAGTEVRIVSLSPAITETVCFLGGRELLVGRSTACDYPESVKQLPAAGDYAGFFPEQIARLNPDVILTNDLSPQAKRQLPLLKGCVTEIPVKTVPDYLLLLRTVGTVIHAPERGAREAEKAEASLRRLEKEAAALRKKPKVLWVIWNTPVMIAGPGSFPDTMIRLSGGENLAASVPQEYFKCSREWLAMHRPDFLIWTVSGVPFREEGIWKGYCTKAVIANLNHSLVLRPGPRMFDGIAELKAHFNSWEPGHSE